MKPTVLIVTTSNWLPTARLAMALAHAGYTVDALCPARHPMGQISAVRKTHVYRGLAPLTSFAHAVARTKPDLIVPGDDLATLHLHHLYEREGGNGEIAKLIERSLGAPESFPGRLCENAIYRTGPAGRHPRPEDRGDCQRRRPQAMGGPNGFPGSA